MRSILCDSVPNVHGHMWEHVGERAVCGYGAESALDQAVLSLVQYMYMYFGVPSHTQMHAALAQHSVCHERWDRVRRAATRGRVAPAS